MAGEGERSALEAGAEDLVQSLVTAQELVLKLLVGEALDLLEEAGPNLRWSLRTTADLLLECGVEGIAVELGEPCELVELPLIALFDQGDLQRLAVEDLAGRRAVGRRSVAIDLDVGDLDRVSRGLCRLFFAGLQRRLAATE